MDGHASLCVASQPVLLILCKIYLQLSESDLQIPALVARADLQIIQGDIGQYKTLIGVSQYGNYGA